MKTIIHSSLDISDSEKEILYSFFPPEQFQITNDIYRPGADNTLLILEFVFSALAGGFLYDVFKEGLIKLYNRITRGSRDVSLTIKYKDQLYLVQGKVIKELQKDGSLIDLDSIQDLIQKLDAEVDKDGDDNTNEV